MSTSTASTRSHSTATPDFAGKRIGDYMINKLSPKRDKWGSRLWSGKCTCGRRVLVSTHALNQNEPKCTHNLRTIETIEKATGCVSIKTSKLARTTFLTYLPKLKEGKLVNDKLPDGTDYFLERVRGYYKGPMYFVRPESLERCQKTGKEDRARKRWEAIPESFLDHGDLCVRAIAIRRKLDLKKAMLGDWDRRGWPILGGTKPRDGRKGYSLHCIMHRLRELGETCDAPEDALNVVAAMLDKLPPAIPADHLRLFSIRMTGRLLGYTVSYLYEQSAASGANAQASRVREGQEAPAPGLVAEKFLVRIPFKNAKGERRKMLDYVVGFTRESVIAVMTRITAGTVPLKTTTLPNLAEDLHRLSPRKAKKSTSALRQRLNAWCSAGLLDAVVTTYWTGKRFITGWLIADESAEAVTNALQSTGWDNAAAEAELKAPSNSSLTKHRIDKMLDGAESDVIARLAAAGVGVVPSDPSSRAEPVHDTANLTRDCTPADKPADPHQCFTAILEQVHRTMEQIRAEQIDLHATMKALEAGQKATHETLEDVHGTLKGGKPFVTIPNTIYYHGDRAFSVGSGLPKTVSDRYDCVLRAFIGARSLDMNGIANRSRLGRDAIPGVMAKLCEVFNGYFSNAIHRPHGKGGGGYQATVVDVSGSTVG
jgi:hypothetical protein